MLNSCRCQGVSWRWRCTRQVRFLSGVLCRPGSTISSACLVIALRTVRNHCVDPFAVADTAALIGVDDCSVAVDAQVVIGGYPRPVRPRSDANK